MKLICTQENFKRAINNSERVVSKQSTLPILNNILFKTEKSNLILNATNLEIGVRIKVAAKIEKEGTITIPGKLIGNFMNNLPSDDNITLETNDSSLKIKSGGAKATIKGLSANDFPLIPQKSSEYLVSLNGNLLKQAVMKVLNCAAINEARQELTGVSAIFGEKEICLAATDSFRLAEVRVDIGQDEIISPDYGKITSGGGNLIIPANTLVELLRIISNNEGENVKIAIEEGQIFFEIGGVQLVSRLISGKYPEYRHIMPKSYKTRLVIGKESLQKAIRMASVFSSSKTSEVSFEIKPGGSKVAIQAESVELGQNITELKADVVGPEQKVILNSRYLLDGINSAETSRVAVLINSETSPVAIKEISEEKGEVLDEYVYIIMPIKNT